MYIIDSEGNIIEGQELSSEEVSILSEMINRDGLNGHSANYISDRDSKKIALWLISKFKMSRRQSPSPPQKQDEDAPIAPESEIIDAE